MSEILTSEWETAQGVKNWCLDLFWGSQYLLASFSLSRVSFLYCTCHLCQILLHPGKAEAAPLEVRPAGKGDPPTTGTQRFRRLWALVCRAALTRALLGNPSHLGSFTWLKGAGGKELRAGPGGGMGLEGGTGAEERGGRDRGLENPERKWGRRQTSSPAFLPDFFPFPWLWKNSKFSKKSQKWRLFAHLGAKMH